MRGSYRKLSESSNVLQSYTEPRRGEMIVAQLFPLNQNPEGVV